MKCLIIMGVCGNPKISWKNKICIPENPFFLKDNNERWDRKIFQGVQFQGQEPLEFPFKFSLFHKIPTRSALWGGSIPAKLAVKCKLYTKLYTNYTQNQIINYWDFFPLTFPSLSSAFSGGFLMF